MVASESVWNGVTPAPTRVLSGVSGKAPP
jgi:hypothetical protein